FRFISRAASPVSGGGENGCPRRAAGSREPRRGALRPSVCFLLSLPRICSR
ncbi:hypothetical protein M9458_020816, partial [Cirrhinus mrigala]